ncbi:hypothetical protein NEF87_005078 [Candidatus Lokiarchaeum ossiferum]|uniref:Uncharacterized protein n=1 Tax=Candidatus Lokiarchaeum ossiferum TaxID=2951803 RepID=A0ABY6HZ37_9ARCH|nr:hypothetical protein NEF87_005078 [Candidatus Lokiarchaeum sp. B-35]
MTDYLEELDDDFEEWTSKKTSKVGKKLEYSAYFYFLLEIGIFLFLIATIFNSIHSNPFYSEHTIFSLLFPNLLHPLLYKDRG